MSIIYVNPYAFGVALDPDAAAYITAVETADGNTLEDAVKTAINTFVVGCKADGIWSAIKASCILAGARKKEGAFIDLKSATQILTNNNFVDGDYDRKTGLVGNGSTKYLNSGRINSDQPQDNSHISAWVSTVATSSGSQFPIYIGSFGNASDNTNGSLHIGRSENNGNFSGRGTSNTFESNLGSGTATGLKGIARSSSTSFTYRNNSASATVNRNSQTPGNAPVLVFAIGVSPVKEYNNGRIAFYSIGESLDLALLDTRVTTLINDFAAAIP
jgi:hypothetical protein